jgi:hypothetical protein
MDPVSILLAGAALLVSLAALYTTSLRGAEIGLDVEIIGGELGRGGAVNDVPADDRLRLCVALSNTGAHGGLVEGVDLDNVEYIGDSPRLWDGVAQVILTSDDVWSPHMTGTTVGLPFALEAGDIQMLYINAPWQPSRDQGKYEPGRAPVWSYAERLRGLRSVRVEITWQYRRVAGGWRSLVPGMGRTRETVKDRTEFVVDGQAWRDACIATWKGNAYYEAETNAILEGREPDPRA